MLRKERRNEMKKYIAIIPVLITLILGGFALKIFAQPLSPKGNSKLTYHNGPVLTGNRNLYFIYYGCWTNTCGTDGDTATRDMLIDFSTSIGGTSYMQINATYPDANGQTSSGYFIFGGESFVTTYSHGAELTRTEVVSIISELINNFELPQDPNGIYVVFSSADVGANDMAFCSPGAPPFHATGIVNGNTLQYAYIGNPRRCPLVAAAPFVGPNGTLLNTPNGTFSGDAMAMNLAHALNGSVTNPTSAGWFDRYGLENADKCTASLGTTYTTANGARANVRMAGRDYLLEQNWVNDKKGRCALSR
jgi:hypothetical protein